MRWVALVAGMALLFACSQTPTSSLAKLVGSQDLVLVDELPGEGGLADLAIVDGRWVTQGTPSKYLFVTSVDTNELRVLQLYRPTQLGRSFVPAPNPIETLSIPVIARPSMLAVDEGLNANGARVTGSYVYAARPGSAVISIVGTAPSELRVVTPSPIPTPGPVTALAAWMGSGLTKLPDTTELFVATFDGRRGAVYRVPLPSSPAVLRAAIANATPANPAIQAEILFDVDAEAVMALQVMPPLAGRTVDGQPFCDTTACLAIATRRAAGLDGRNLLIDPKSLRAVPLDFQGPVRDFATIGNGFRLFGVLDEEKCGSAECGGVLAVDTGAASGATGFARALDFSGEPMLPITTGGSLPTGLALGQGAQLRQTLEVYDAGSNTREVGLALVGYDLLGVVASSNGQLTFFDGLAGMPIDYDARRTTVSSASMLVPAVLSDGGIAFTGADGGFIGYTAEGPLTETIPPVQDGGISTEPWRIISVGNPDGGDGSPYVLDVSDGYLLTQNLVVIYEGLLPGLVRQPTTYSDGTTLFVTTGYEGRASPGDRVFFYVDSVPDGGFTDGGVTAVGECGQARVTAVDAGILLVDSLPPECVDRTSFSVRASGLKPYVAAADLEGYLGRAAVGDTLTYTRRYLVKPFGWTENRPALRVTLGDTLPLVTGAYWTFALEGGLASYVMSIDSQSCSSPWLPGRLAMARLPTLYEGGTTDFPWTVAGVLPSGNSVYEIPLSGAFRGAVTSTDGLRCYR
ncbi:MAG: hypothetical protein AB1938_29950 [Myxococcota bacterium]